METPSARSEYYLVNGARFDALAGRVERLLGHAQDRTVATLEPNGAAPILTDGIWSAESMVTAYADSDVEISAGEAEELAEIENDAQRKVADLEIRAARSGICMRTIADQSAAEGSGQDQDADDEALFWGFSEARWAQAAFYTDEGLEVTISSVHFNGSITGLEESSYRIFLNDGVLIQAFHLMSIDHEIRHVDFEVSQANDGLLGRCGQILGRQQSRVIPLLGGHFEDESELDAALNELWADLQTTAAEEEVGYLLDEVRQRSLAAKQAIKLHTVHELGLPNQDKLDEFERALG